jgi:signal transduction histidine kinase/tetratricopeptide (TPR) repeat protein
MNIVDRLRTRHGLYGFILIMVVIVFTMQARVSAQIHTIDSLTDLLQTSLSDTTRVNTLNALAYAHYTAAPDKTERYAREAIALAQKIGFTRGVAEGYRELGISFNNRARQVEALSAFHQSFTLFTDIKDKQGLGNIMNNFGLAYDRQGNYTQALEAHFKALNYREALMDKRGLAISLNNIGEVYRKKGQQQQAREYLLRALKFAEETDYKLLLSVILYNLGAGYRSEGNTGIALQYLQRAVPVCQTIGNKVTLTDVYWNMGVIERDNGRFIEAEYLLGQSLALANSIKSHDKSAAALSALAETYRSDGRVAKAIQTAARALEMAQLSGAKAEIQQAAEVSWYAYRSAANWQKALEAHEIYTLYKDSIFNNESAKRLADLENSRKIEQQQTQLEAMRQQQSFQQYALYGAVTFVLVLLGSLGFTTRANRQRKAANDQLQTNNLELIAANEEVQRQSEIQSEQSREIEMANSELHEKNLALDTTLQALQAAQSQLVQSERMNAAGMLTAGVMHEINNPNAAVTAAVHDAQQTVRQIHEFFLNLLDEKGKQSKRAQIFADLIQDAVQSLAVAETGAHRIKGIVSNLQGFTKHQRAGMYETDIRAELESTIEMFRYQFKHIETNLLVKEDVKIVGNAGELNQVFLNLLVNAAQAGSTRIDITTSISDMDTTVQISDNGHGMTEEIRDKIFNAFFSTKGTANSGLGLSITKQILERHNATVGVESEPKKGTTFTVSFPREGGFERSRVTVV